MEEPSQNITKGTVLLTKAYTFNSYDTTASKSWPKLSFKYPTKIELQNKTKQKCIICVIFSRINSVNINSNNLVIFGYKLANFVVGQQF